MPIFAIRLLNAYIGRVVFQATCLTLLFFLGLDSFIQLLREFHQISPRYDVLDALITVALRLPSDVYTFFPLIASLGSVLGLSSIANGNELIAMQASGLSLKQLLLPALSVISVILLLVTGFGESVGIRFNQWSFKHKIANVSAGQFLSTSSNSGGWIHLHDDFVHIQRVLDPYTLKGILQYRFNDRHVLSSIAYAKRAKFDQGHWILYNLQESRFQNRKIATNHLKHKVWSVQLDAKLLVLLQREPNQETIPTLYKVVISGFNVSPKIMQRYEYAFWSRLFQPILTLLLVAASVPWVTGSLRSKTMGIRILMSLLLGIGFYLLNRLLGPLSLVWGLSSLLAASIPIILLSGFLWIIWCYGIM